MIALMLLGSALAVDPCQERLQSIQIAAQGTVKTTVQLGGRESVFTLQVVESLGASGLRYGVLEALSGHHADGTAWLRLSRSGQPIVALNEHLLDSNPSGSDWHGDASLLVGVEPAVIALVFASMERVGGDLEPVGGAVLDWMYARCGAR